MAEATNRGFEEADAAVKRTVNAFMNQIELMFGKWEAVAPAHIVEGALVELCEEVSELAEDIKTTVGPATQKPLAAMAEYRDAKAKGPLEPVATGRHLFHLKLTTSPLPWFPRRRST